MPCTPLPGGPAGGVGRAVPCPTAPQRPNKAYGSETAAALCNALRTGEPGTVADAVLILCVGETEFGGAVETWVVDGYVNGRRGLPDPQTGHGAVFGRRCGVAVRVLGGNR